jgi:predicted dehydrogenase
LIEVKHFSWELELRNFVAAIKENRGPVGTLQDAHTAMKIVFDIYKWSRTHE